MNPLRLLSLSLLGAGSVLLASSAIIQGRLLDKGKEVVIGANVRLLTLPDSTFVKASSTDFEGKFRIDSIQPGKYALVPDAFGMRSAPTVINIRTFNDSVDVKDIVLQDETTVLQDLVVTGRHASIVTKQDTIEFNAGSFKTAQNANVEDLLKKLPGVEVSSDGAVTSQGKSVTKILVDGEEFFSDDPKLATKNLRSDMIEKVQVIDRKTEEARLTGVDTGEEETVINLTIKKGQKQGWFGNFMAGYGTDDRYNFGFNINRFVNNGQITLLGAANNVNDMSFTDSGRGRFRDFGGGNSGIIKSESLGLNFALGSSESFRIGGNILFTHSDQDYRRRASTEYLFPDSVSYQNSWSEARNKGYNLRADLRIQWKLDPNNTIDFRPGFSFNHRDSEKNDTTNVRAGDALRSMVNSQDNFQDNTGNSWQAQGTFIYTHSFPSRQGRKLSLQLDYNFSDTKEHGTSWSDIMYYLLKEDSEDANERLYRFIDNHTWSNSIGGRVTWVEPIGNPANGNALNFAYRIKYNFNNADKLTYDLPFEDAVTENMFSTLKATAADGTLNESLSNSFRNDFFNQEFTVGFQREVKDYSLGAGVMLTPSMSRSEDLINSARNIPERWVWNVAPYLRFRYKFSRTKNLNIRYNARTTQPSMTQLQPVADESDPLHITVGNPDLKPSFTQRFNLHFGDFDPSSQRSYMIVMMASHTLNGIVSRTTSDPVTGAQTTTYANVNNGISLMGGGFFNQPIGKAHWRLTANLFATYNNNPGYINGDLNRSGNLSLRPSLGITFTNDILQWSLRPNYSLNYTHNSLPMQPNRTVHTYGGTADFTLTLPMGIELSSDLNFNKTAGYASGYDQNEWLWNAQVSYSMLSDRSLTLAVKVYDILQQRSSISRNVTATYISDEWVNSLTRYAMATLTWRFQAFGGRKGAASFDEGEFGPPMGMPPGGMRGGRGERPSGPPPGHF